MNKKTSVQCSEETFMNRIEEALKRYRKRVGEQKYSYLEDLLRDLMKRSLFPIELLDKVPEPAYKSGITKFDQIYQAAMFFAHPQYSGYTHEQLTGSKEPSDLRVWQVIIPPGLGPNHVLIKANSYQEAFALGCDYVCRASLRVNKKIPTDLNIRVIYVTNRELKYMLKVKDQNKLKNRRKREHQSEKKKTYQKFSRRQIIGATAVALGHDKKSEMYSILKYIDKKELDIIQKKFQVHRITNVLTQYYPEDLHPSLDEDPTKTGVK